MYTLYLIFNSVSKKSGRVKTLIISGIKRKRNDSGLCSKARPYYLKN